MAESRERHARYPWNFIVLALIIGLIVGGISTAYLTYQQIGNLKKDVSSLEKLVYRLSGNQTIYSQTITILQNGTALADLYENVKNSVVMISAGDAQGSGFVYNSSGTIVVITNHHVIHGASTISVAFSSGNEYPALRKGDDPYSDLAVLTVNAPENEFKPIEIVSSSTLVVGEPVIAIGTPYGLVGSLTTGIVSALNRSIDESQYTGGFAIANVIQTSTPINPGNSGGPLLNYDGKVIGITTAVVEDSQGLGFAIPSNTIRKELDSLIARGTYDQHSYLGLKGTNMDYLTAQKYNINVTYGWRVVEVVRNGPAYDAGIQVGDVITEINWTKIRSGDEMSSFLEENTIPLETVIVTIERGKLELEKPLILGKRPAPPA